MDFQKVLAQYMEIEGEYLTKNSWLLSGALLFALHRVVCRIPELSPLRQPVQAMVGQYGALVMSNHEAIAKLGQYLWTIVGAMGDSKR